VLLHQALAQYTDRSIISIPLAKIKTNQELMDIVFDQHFAVVGEALSSKLPFGKTIFVMVGIPARHCLRCSAQIGQSRSSICRRFYPAILTADSTQCLWGGRQASRRCCAKHQHLLPSSQRIKSAAERVFVPNKAGCI